MVFNLDPLDIALDFDRKRYGLGDTINATVTLFPNGNVEIRKATLNLVAEVRRTEVKMGRTMDMGGASTLQGGNTFTSTDYIPMQQTTEQKTSTEVGYTTAFLNSTSLRVGHPGKYNVALELGPRPPRVVQLEKELELDTNSSLTIKRWWLEVQVDVVRGRDESMRKEIDVTFS